MIIVTYVDIVIAARLLCIIFFISSRYLVLILYRYINLINKINKR